MTARHSVRSSPGAALWLACALALAPAALLAQSEPTPFWMAAPPQKEPPPKPAKVPAKKPKPPARNALDDEPVTLVKKRPAKKPPARAPPAKKSPPKRAQSVDDEEEEAPQPAKKHRYEPLPPLPHIEPEAVPSRPQPQAPYRAPVQAAPAPAQPEPRYAPPAYAPPTYPAPAPVYPPPTYAPPTYAAPTVPAPTFPPATYPAPARGQAVVPQAVVPIAEERTGSRNTLDESSEEAPPLRRFSAELIGGLWVKAASDGQSHNWQAAYGIDLGLGIFRWLQLDVRGVRSSGTDGDAYVNATTSHTLVDGHLLGVINFGSLAVFGGGGGGIVFEKTKLYLQDIGSDPTTLSSSGLEPVGEVALGLRWRPWRGLTTRLELDGMLRQGNVEALVLLGAGWSF